jgi:diacylglycerol kinase (ATP)
MSAPKRILFIINPISGVGKKNTIPPLIRKKLDHSRFVHEIVYTERKRHGHEIAQAEKSNYDVIVAVGGDGSVNEIVSALTGSPCALAILPCGSGNGLARHAGISMRLDKAIERINRFEPTRIDTGTINDLPFLGTCGFGFDGYIAQKFDAHHKRGFISYIRLVLREFKHYKTQPFRFIFNGETQSREGLICTVANASQFGNNFTISPMSDFSDGKLEFIIIKKFSLWKTPGIALKFFKKRIHTSAYFEKFDIKDSLLISISENNEMDFHIDGEPAGKAASFKIEIRPSGLILV